MADSIKISAEQAAAIDKMIETFEAGDISPVAVTPALVAIIAATAVANGSLATTTSGDLEKLRRIEELVNSLDATPSLQDLKAARSNMMVDE